MTSQDNGDKKNSKKVLDWLNQNSGTMTAISIIVSILIAIFDRLLQNPSHTTKIVMPVFVGIFIFISIIFGAVYVYQRFRAARLKISESLEPLSETAFFRGLLPFEDGQPLPGRAQDVQELYTLISSRLFRFGVLCGATGCGKTSLLRAGLVPKLRNEKFLPIYIDRPTSNPQETIRSALLKEVPNLEKHTDKSLSQLLKSSAPKGKKFVVLFDQFEEFLQANKTSRSRVDFVGWLGESIADEDMPVVFLIGIREEFLAKLLNFSPEIPEPTSSHTTFQLKNFESEQAKQILSAAAKADGVPFESGLIQAVIRELETDEFIRPAELQIVGTRLKRDKVYSLRRYETLRGAKGILRSYITDEIKQSPNEQTAQLILRMMCTETGEAKSPTDLSMDDIVGRIIGEGNATASKRPARKAKEIQKILDQFINARVLIRTDDNKYNLVHDYLAPRVREATEGAETNTERANRWLKRYLAEYKEDAKTRIPFGRARSIQKYASPEEKSKDRARELIKKSMRGAILFQVLFGGVVVGAACLLCWLVVIVYAIKTPLPSVPTPDDSEYRTLSVHITNVTVDESNRYVVEYATYGYLGDWPGNHVQIFFNTVAPTEANGSQSAPWVPESMLLPELNRFVTKFHVSDRPAKATQMCALVAPKDSVVIPNSGNCIDLPNQQ